MRAAATAAILFVSLPVFAVPFTAQVTDVADAVDVDNVFDFQASVGFRRIVKNARLTREGRAEGGGFALVDAMKHSVTSQILDIRASVGLFHDLELSFYLPYTISQNSLWDHPDDGRINAENSPVLNDPTLGGPLFGLPYNTYQRGLNSMDIGIGWSPLSDQRDDTKPTITLRFTYGAPIGSAFRPSPTEVSTANGTDSNNPAPVGEKIHRLRFDAAFSKRFGPVEPYFAANYVQTIADGGGIEGLAPPVTGGFITGFELIPWDVPKERRRLAFDVRAGVQYVGPGRTYSELTGPLRQATYADNYTNLSIGAHLTFNPIEYVRLTSGITFSHDTAHFITNESPGRDGTSGVVDLTDPTQVNPRYRPEIDGIGRRFKAEDVAIFTWYVALGLML